MGGKGDSPEEDPLMSTWRDGREDRAESCDRWACCQVGCKPVQECCEQVF